MNLIEGILAECNRVRELVRQYETIGSRGAFAVAALNRDIKEGEDAVGLAMRCG